VSSIKNDKLHLTCYAITFSASLPKSVITNDQFGPLQLSLAPANELCLPAGKRR
jgi:hypothetical protein